MTCIVGFIDRSKRKMTIGGDRLGSNGHTGSPVEQPKVFKSGKLLFGYTSSFRFGQILEMYFSPPKDNRKTSYSYMVMDVVPAIRKLLEDHKYSSSDDKGTSGTILIMYKGGIFVLQSDWAILEYGTIQSVGSGSEVAYGALYAVEETNLSSKKKVELAIEAASSVIVSVGGKCDTITTKY